MINVALKNIQSKDKEFSPQEFDSTVRLNQHHEEHEI